MEESKKEERRKTYRSAKIDVVANGFIIEIGCQKLVANTPGQLKQLICNYLDDPYKTERSIMRDHLSGNNQVEAVDRPVNEASQPFSYGSNGLGRS